MHTRYWPVGAWFANSAGGPADLVARSSDGHAVRTATVKAEMFYHLGTLSVQEDPRIDLCDFYLLAGAVGTRGHGDDPKPGCRAVGAGPLRRRRGGTRRLQVDALQRELICVRSPYERRGLLRASKRNRDCARVFIRDHRRGTGASSGDRFAARASNGRNALAVDRYTDQRRRHATHGVDASRLPVFRSALQRGGAGGHRSVETDAAPGVGARLAMANHHAVGRASPRDVEVLR